MTSCGRRLHHARPPEEYPCQGAAGDGRMTSPPKSRDSDTWVSGLEPLGPDEVPEPAVPEVRIGPYRLREKLGEGGMGTVWVAEQTEPVRRRVALKVIKTGMDSQEILQRFEAERQALA